MAQAASLLDQRENRYYWLRLKEDFFEDDRVRIIESSPDGEKILLFYLKLMLKSIKGEGEVLKGTGHRLHAADAGRHHRHRAGGGPAGAGAAAVAGDDRTAGREAFYPSDHAAAGQRGQEHREGPPQPQQVKEKQFFRAGRYIRVTM